MHQKHIVQYASSLEAINLNWLVYFIWAGILLGGLWIADNIFIARLFNSEIPNLIYLIGLFYMAYHSIKQVEIYPVTQPKEPVFMKETSIHATNQINLLPDTGLIMETGPLHQFENQHSIPNQAAYPLHEEIELSSGKKKLLSDEALEVARHELVQYMKSKKPFLNSEVNLAGLSSQLGISSHLLSYIINNGCKVNFYQFINGYRVEEAKILLLDPKHTDYSILGVGFTVGFNSKTVFNTTFKNMVGQTPSTYRKEGFK